MSFLNKSPWISFYDSGDCNGCVLEVVALLNPKFDIERFGCIVKASVKHADILIVSGIINIKQKERLLQVYNQMAKPKLVVALGACPISGGVFGFSYNRADELDKIIPVDVYIPGCPPRPETIIDGIVKGLKKAGLNENGEKIE